MKIPPIHFLLLFFQCTTLFAQKTDDAIYRVKSSSLSIGISGGSLEITEHIVSEKEFYKNFEKHSEESIFYSDFDNITDIEAATLIPNGKDYKKIKVSTIETHDIVQSGIFYGGHKRKDFVFPLLSAGAIGKLEYDKKIVEPHLLSPFYFNEPIDVKSASFKVTFPREVTLGYKLYGDQKDKISFQESTDGNKTVYTWTLTDIPAYRKEKDSPAMPYSATHIVLYINSYQYHGKKYPVLTTVSDLYNWYSTLLDKIPSYNETSLKSFVQQLTRQATTDEEKTRIIFQWVQHNIKYIAFEDGMAGFIPRSAEDVYTKRYGDCKDMANLLQNMLTLCGIKAYRTWIGTRSKPYSYFDIPTAVVNNHMICSTKSGNDYIFLDATNPFLSYGNPSSMIQGKEALVGLTSDRYEIVKVPVVSRSGNFRNDSLFVTLNKTGVSGRFESTLKGYKKDDLEIAQLRSEINNDREHIRDFFTVGNNNIVIEDLSVKGLEDQNVPAKVRFNFSLPAYYRSLDNKIYFNMNLNKSLPGEKLDATNRMQILEQDYCYEDTSVISFAIPEGYSASFIPANTSKDWLEFGVHATYRATENTIILERTIYSNFLYLGKDKFQQWNEFLQILNTINQQSIILSKNN